MPNSAGRFEDILDRCIVAIQTRNWSIEDCLAQYPTERAELEPLLLLAVRLRRARAVAAPQEFQQTAAVRMRNLIATASPYPHAAAEQLPFGARRADLMSVLRSARATKLVGLMLVLFLAVSSGAVVASASALPGQPLYPIKSTVENLQLALSPGEATATRLRISFADKRLQEASALIERNDLADANDALTAFVFQIEQMLALFDSETRLSPQARSALAQQLADALSGYQARLAALRTGQASMQSPALEAALTISQSGLRRSLLLLGDKPLAPSASGGSLPPELDTPSTVQPGSLQTTASPAPDSPTPTALVASFDTPTPSATPTAQKVLPQPTARSTRQPPRPLPTELPTRHLAPERTALPTGRPVRPTDLPIILPTERPTRPALMPTRPIRPTDLPPVRPPLITPAPTGTPAPLPTEWPTWPAQTETPWPAPPGVPIGTPAAPPTVAPPRPILPPGLRETITAVPRP